MGSPDRFTIERTAPVLRKTLAVWTLARVILYAAAMHIVLLLSATLALLSVSPASAADASALAAARKCEEMVRPDAGGWARAEWYRRYVACLKDLYVLIGVPHSSEAVRIEIQRRLDALEQAYYASRALCEIRQHAGEEPHGCGTLSLATVEFPRLLKTMIVNEDAGWVREDARLREALNLKAPPLPQRGEGISVPSEGE